jgi:GNAT superfamily N-acetyltransferase
MNRGRAAKTADFWPALHARNNGIFYRGVGPNALSKGKYIAALGRGLYVTWNEATARAFAGEGGTVIRYRLPLDLVLLDDQSRDMGVIKMRMGLDPWDVAGGPHYADIVRMQVQKLGYDGAISSDRFTGIVVYDLDRAEALDPVPKTPRPKRRPKTPKRPRRPKKPKIRRLKDLPNRGRAARGDPLWHITSRKSFKPSTEFRPITAGGMNRAREPMLYATRDPNYWHNVSGGGMGPWTRGRKWAAELELLPGHPPVARENPLRPQTQLDPAFVRVKRIIPVNEAIAEVTGWRDPGPGEGDGTGGSVWVGADYRYTPPAPKKKRGRGKASPANDFMDSYERFTEPHPYERHWRVWPNGIYTRLDKIAPWVLKDAVTLRVIVSPDERSKGEASRVLRHIARLADEHLVKVTLSAKPFTGIEDKLNQDDLVAWYGRHGWKRRKLHTFNQMIRVPDLLGGLFTKD